MENIKRFIIFNHLSRGLGIVIYQIVFLLLLPFYLLYGEAPSTELLLISFTLAFFNGFSLTGGYHRLYSHKTFKVPPFIEAIILLFGSMSFQRSALRWVFEHRLHHKYVDTENDPYSINKGFWYAHIFWLFDKPRPIDKKIVSDLLKNPLIVLQHRFDALLMISSNVLITLWVGWYVNDYVGAIMISFLMRLFVVHHSTFLINSAAHTFGSRPYSKTISAVNNFIISILTLGEGSHNFHHVFPNDYRSGIRWFDIDPPKWVIWSLSKIGLAKDLKRANPDLIAKKRLLVEKQD